MKDRNSLSKTTGPKSRFRKNVAASIIVVLGLMMIFGLATTFRASAQESTAVKEISPEQARISQWGLIAAAVAFGFGALGAGIAIANVGAAAMGAIGEKPEIAGQALIFIALAEGLVVFGFITALMILGKF
jgi:V/A-type H+-transporting ATPase subunit K